MARFYNVRFFDSFLDSWLLLLLAAPGCPWLPLVAPGCSWLLLVAPGCSWLLLAAPGSSWLLPAAPGCSACLAVCLSICMSVCSLCSRFTKLSKMPALFQIYQVFKDARFVPDLPSYERCPLCSRFTKLSKMPAVLVAALGYVRLLLAVLGWSGSWLLQGSPGCSFFPVCNAPRDAYTI